MSYLRLTSTFSLYSMVDDPADKLKIGPTRKKNRQVSFYFIFSSMPWSCPKIKHFSGKKLANLPKRPKIQWNPWNYLFVFIFFFPPTWKCRHIFFLYDKLEQPFLRYINSSGFPMLSRNQIPWFSMTLAWFFHDWHATPMTNFNTDKTHYSTLNVISL